MSNGRRPALAALVVFVVAMIASVCVTGIRVANPTSGGSLALGHYRPEGVVVTILPDVATTLRDGDLVVVMDGRTTLAWADTVPAAGRSPGEVGDVVPFEIVRGGETLAVDVPLSPFPAGAVLLDAWGTLTFVGAMLVMGVFVFWRRPLVPASGALLLSAAGAVGSTVPFLLGNDPLDLTDGVIVPMTVGTSLVYLLLWGGLIDFFLVFPRPFGRLGTRPSLRVVPYAAVAVSYLGAVAIARFTEPTALAWIASWGYWTILPTLITFAATPVILVLRWRRADAPERQLLRAFGWVLGFIVAVDAVIWLIPELLRAPVLIPWSMAALIGLPFPILIAVAILRYGAFDFDVVIRRSVVYGGLTIAVIAVYVVVAAGLGAILGSASAFATSLLATGITALAALPIRDALQRASSRLIYGDRDEPVRAIRRLGDRLEASVDPESMPRVVVDTVGDALRLPYVGLELGTAPAARLAAERGSPPAELVERPLVFQGRIIGRLLVAARGPADPLSASDLRLLDDLAQQVGVAAHAALLTEDLRASRERLVTAREEERRRLRRDLHDGLGPALAAIGMRAGAAESLVRDDPDRAADLLAELQAEVSAAVVDVRRLVDALRPPAIDEVGLVGALRLAAGRLESPGSPRLEVESDGRLPELPAAVEVAAYRIGTEAMTNAVRHAGAATCSLRLVGGSDLTVVVEDDGRGLPTTPRAGVGLVSMHERAAELGGECRVEPRPGGGTRVVARLPLVAPA
ncbi:MAG TPA: sensor histidine kinase [Candidatus Limnocylindrales bacterium]|nr:sensor histidine kinase [Candidatus Limnocylindrales bacterium]